MMTTVEARTWQVYEYPTVMPCACGDRCPLGGDHALYGGISWLPTLRDRQHAARSPWYGHRSGPMRVLPDLYYSEADARSVESALIGSGRYLANDRGNEGNPCRWSFDPAEVRLRRRKTARRQARRRLVRRLLKTIRKKRGAKTMLRTVAYWALIAMVVFYVVKHPGQSAGAIRGIASGAGDFLTGLFS